MISSLTFENKNTYFYFSQLGEMSERNRGYPLVNTRPDNDQDVEVRCGYGKCRPKILGSCNNPKIMLAIMSFYVFAQGFYIS